MCSCPLGYLESSQQAHVEDWMNLPSLKQFQFVCHWSNVSSDRESTYESLLELVCRDLFQMQIFSHQKNLASHMEHLLWPLPIDFELLLFLCGMYKELDS